MFIHGKIQAANNSELMIQKNQTNKYVSRGLGAFNLSDGNKVEAYAGGRSGGISTSAVGTWASEYQYTMSGILPADPLINDYSSLRPFYRDMYLLDATAGSAVDIQSTFPFSDFSTRGLNTKELRPFNEALERLNLRRMLPEISVAYLTDGFFCGTMVFDPQEKQFIDTMIHDALQCTVLNQPFYNIDPEIQVRVSGALQNFLNSESPYSKRYLASLPPVFVKLLQAGQFTLDPIATLFVPRKNLTDRAYTSYLHRLLPFYLIEKTLFRGTLTEAHKRQRSITHITAGDDTWMPTGEELFELVQMFQQAELDPLGGWVTTRNAVQATDIRQAGDFWKWYEVLDSLTPYKLRALGISESFLTGESSFAAAESAYAVFMESIDSYRNHLTDAVFNKKIFPLIALVNGLYKDGYDIPKNVDVINFLANAKSRASLKIPELEWRKQLNARDDSGMMDALEKLDERGIPIPMKAWVAAAGVDFDALVNDLNEDPEIRGILDEHLRDSPEEDDFDIDASYKVFGGPMGATTVSLNKGGTRRRSLLSRDFGDSPAFGLTRTGKKKHIINQSAARKRQNDMLMKAHRLMKDPNNQRNAVLRAKYAKMRGEI